MLTALHSSSLPGRARFIGRHSQEPQARRGVYDVVVWMCGVLAVFGLFIESVKAADAGGEAKNWLEKISTASQTVSYEGNFIYRRDDQLVTMHLIHVASPKGEREQLISLSGGQRELLRSKDGVVCIFPDKKHVTFNNRGGLNKHFPGQLAAHVGDLERNYRISLGGRDRIAGRSARMIIVEPMDNYRYGYRIWVDEKTGLLLQSDLVNEHGNAMEQVMFTTLNVVPKPTPEMVKAVTMDEQTQRSLLANKRKQHIISLSDMPWKITRMPKGFSLAEHYQHLRGKRSPVEQLVLTDGMATVSVFVEHANDAKASFKGITHMGAVNAFGTVVADHQLTVVGEVPAATVRLIGHSLNFAKATH